MDKIIYDQDGITLTKKEVMDAMPSPIQMPPLRKGETERGRFDKLFATMKLALIVKKAKELKGV